MTPNFFPLHAPALSFYNYAFSPDGPWRYDVEFSDAERR